MPRCGFSMRVVGVLDQVGVEYGAIDVLPALQPLREVTTELSDWQTFPQLYVNGELVGGCDIVEEMLESGELAELLGVEQPADAQAPEPAAHPARRLAAEPADAGRLARAAGALERALPADIELVELAPGALVAPARLRRSTGVRPPRRVGELVLQRPERRLGGLDLALEPLGVGDPVLARARRRPASFARTSTAPRSPPRRPPCTRPSRRHGCAAGDPRSRSCASRPPRAAPGRGRSAAPCPRSRSAHPRAPRGSRGRGGWWARRGSAGWRPCWSGSPAPAGAPPRPRARRALSPPPRRRTGSGRAAPGSSPRRARSSAAHARARWPRRRRRARSAGRGSRGSRCGRGATCPSRARGCRSGSRPGSTCPSRWGRPGRRARPARATSRRVGDQGPARDLEPRLLELEHDPARALRRAEREGEGSAVARRRLAGAALEPLDALQLRLRLARLGRLVAEALDEALHARDLGLAAGGVAAGGELARGLLDSPRVPRPGEVARPARLELEHRGADRFEEPAVVSDQDDRRVELDQVALEPLERLDVEMVRRLVEQQQIRPRGERPGQRGPGQLAAREARQRPVELGAVEAETADGGGRAVAPAIAAGELEARLGVRVARERLRGSRRRRTCGSRAPPARARSRGSTTSPRARSRAATNRRVAGAGRGARPWRPCGSPACRRRSRPRPRASAAGWSCRCRCAPRAPCDRRARA